MLRFEADTGPIVQVARPVRCDLAERDNRHRQCGGSMTLRWRGGIAGFSGVLGATAAHPRRIPQKSGAARWHAAHRTACRAIDLLNDDGMRRAAKTRRACVAQPYIRVIHSATRAGLGSFSVSMVIFQVTCAPPRISSTACTTLRARIRAPARTGLTKRTRFRP